MGQVAIKFVHFHAHVSSILESQLHPKCQKKYHEINVREIKREKAQIKCPKPPWTVQEMV